MNNRNLKGNSNAGRKGKVVITGAGVGRATAQRFARVGACLGLIGRDQASLEQAANEVRDLGG
jgi:short-subunit dehydrogenase